MEIKILSSLAKVFPDEICGGYEQDGINCLKNERTSFQIAFRCSRDEIVKIRSDCKYLAMYKIRFVPVGLTAPDDRDSFFIRNAEPGDYPDALIPLDGEIAVKKDEWNAVWCEFSPSGLITGEYMMDVFLNDEKASVKADVLSASFGKQSLICTHWFHTDCLASVYGVKVFSDEYWRITESFMRDAVKHGINCILTPLFTPPLDTEVGGERPTVQLVDVEKQGDKYYFCLEKLQRWVNLAMSCGVKYFEMSHLYTQWGAEHAPKIMARTKDGYKRIFGWGTDAHSWEYTNFLRQLAPELISFIDKNSIHDRCFFHASDEPERKNIESYAKASEVLHSLFGKFTHIDALSDYGFYENGLVTLPATNIEKIDDFVGKVPELWTYYCCNPYKENLPNRFIAMPSVRNRILGFIMYKYDVKGFLHWGFDFYYTRYSKREVNPFKETDAGHEFSSGDSFVVYPGEDGKPYDSLRLKVFYDAVQDFEALRLLEKKIGREKTLALLENDIDTPITARNYPHSEEWLLNKRKEINKALAD